MLPELDRRRIIPTSSPSSSIPIYVSVSRMQFPGTPKSSLLFSSLLLCSLLESKTMHVHSQNCSDVQKNVVKGCVTKTMTHSTFDHVFWRAEYMHSVAHSVPLSSSSPTCNLPPTTAVTHSRRIELPKLRNITLRRRHRDPSPHSQPVNAVCEMQVLAITYSLVYIFEAGSA